MTDSLYELGQDEHRDHGVATAPLTISLLIGLHGCDMVAPLRHADGRTYAVGHRKHSQIIDRRETFRFAFMSFEPLVERAIVDMHSSSLPEPDNRVLDGGRSCGGDYAEGAQLCLDHL